MDLFSRINLVVRTISYGGLLRSSQRAEMQIAEVAVPVLSYQHVQGSNIGFATSSIVHALKSTHIEMLRSPSRKFAYSHAMIRTITRFTIRPILLPNAFERALWPVCEIFVF
uniref:Uncharacterized protein n=1 Tax=Schistocephalus solidus TaxID=70667 RepID=A0A0X3NP16_SCHSO